MSEARSIVNAQEQPHDFRVGQSIMTIRPTYRLRMPDGRVHRFSWHKFCGPLWLNANDDPLRRQPGPRNPVWIPFGFWVQQGYRVDQDGNCIWSPEADSPQS